MKREVWRQRSNTTRLLAGLASLLLSFGALLSLSYRPTVPTHSAPRAVGVTLLVSPRQVPVPPERVSPAVTRFAEKRNTVKQSTAPTRAPADALVESTPETLPAPISETIAATAASAPASGVPLLIDSQAIRRALVGTTGQVRKLAERGGVALDSPRKGQLQVFGASVAKAAKPGCLAPNEYGSLLSIPLIAAKAIQGMCK